MSEEITAIALAEQMEGIYAQFTESVRSIGSKNGIKGKSKMAVSALHWLTGGHIKTERDVLCDKFLQDVQAQLQTFDDALEEADAETAQAACERIARTMTQPVPADSNSTTDLMKRAMVSQLKPYLPRLSKEALQQTKERMETAYPKSKRLPIEKEVLKEIGQLL